MDSPKYLNAEQRAEFKEEDVYGCALPNLLREGYVVKHVKFERDHPDEHSEHWKVTLRRREGGEPEERAVMENEDGSSRFLCGDPERYDSRYVSSAINAVTERGWRIVRRVHGPEEEVWLTIIET
ncbi:MAG: hypothetical protein AB7P00_20305 [Sandaracinaceae bacterium]